MNYLHFDNSEKINSTIEKVVKEYRVKSLKDSRYSFMGTTKTATLGAMAYTGIGGKWAKKQLNKRIMRKAGDAAANMAARKTGMDARDIKNLAKGVKSGVSSTYNSGKKWLSSTDASSTANTAKNAMSGLYNRAREAAKRTRNSLGGVSTGPANTSSAMPTINS